MYNDLAWRTRFADFVVTVVLHETVALTLTQFFVDIISGGTHMRRDTVARNLAIARKVIPDIFESAAAGSRVCPTGIVQVVRMLQLTTIRETR